MSLNEPLNRSDASGSAASRYDERSADNTMSRGRRANIRQSVCGEASGTEAPINVGRASERNAQVSVQRRGEARGGQYCRADALRSIDVCVSTDCVAQQCVR